MRKLSRNKDGYYFVTLVKDGRNAGRMVHRLVLESFIGPRPAGLSACHENGDKSDNRPENLRWDTHASNMRDKARHGTVALGEKASRHKLTAEQVIAIRNAPRGQAAALGRAFGVTKGATSAIRLGRNWTHLTTGAA